MKFIICFLFLFCAFPTGEKIDNRILPIVSEFFFLRDGKIVDNYPVTVVVGHLENPKWMGMCRVGIFGPEVTISEDFFKSESYLQTHSTTFHELGHCVLGRGHYPPTSWSDVRSIRTFMMYINHLRGKEIEVFMKDGCPASIMYWANFSDYCYLRHFEEYIDELFRKDI